MRRGLALGLAFSLFPNPIPMIHAHTPAIESLGSANLFNGQALAPAQVGGRYSTPLSSALLKVLLATSLALTSLSHGLQAQSAQASPGFLPKFFHALTSRDPIVDVDEKELRAMQPLLPAPYRARLDPWIAASASGTTHNRAFLRAIDQLNKDLWKEGHGHYVVTYTLGGMINLALYEADRTRSWGTGLHTEADELNATLYVARMRYTSPIISGYYCFVPPGLPAGTIFRIDEEIKTIPNVDPLESGLDNPESFYLESATQFALLRLWIEGRPHREGVLPLSAEEKEASLSIEEEAEKLYLTFAGQVARSKRPVTLLRRLIQDREQDPDPAAHLAVGKLNEGLKGVTKAADISWRAQELFEKSGMTLPTLGIRAWQTRAQRDSISAWIEALRYGTGPAKDEIGGTWTKEWNRFYRRFKNTLRPQADEAQRFATMSRVVQTLNKYLEKTGWTLIPNDQTPGGIEVARLESSVTYDVIAKYKDGTFRKKTITVRRGRVLDPDTGEDQSAEEASQTALIFGNLKNPSVFEDTESFSLARRLYGDILNPKSPYWEDMKKRQTPPDGRDIRQMYVEALVLDGWIENGKLKPGFFKALEEDLLHHEFGHYWTLKPRDNTSQNESFCYSEQMSGIMPFRHLTERMANASQQAALEKASKNGKVENFPELLFSRYLAEGLQDTGLVKRINAFDPQAPWDVLDRVKALTPEAYKALAETVFEELREKENGPISWEMKERSTHTYPEPGPEEPKASSTPANHAEKSNRSA